MICCLIGLQVIFGVPFGHEIDMWSLGCILAEVYNMYIFRYTDKPQ